MQMKITTAQARELLDNRKNSTKSGAKRQYNSTGKSIKKRIYSQIRKEHGIPTSTKIKFFIESPDHPLYRVIRDKRSGVALDDGMSAPVAAIKKAAPAKKVAAPGAKPKAVPVKAATTKKVAAAPQAKAAVAKKAVVKAVAKPKAAPAKAVAKPKAVPAKKVVVKAVAKPVAKKVAVKAVAKPAAKKVTAKK